jgi:hypothetical protein
MSSSSKLLSPLLRWGHSSCFNCEPRKPRADWAPSPIRPTGAYSFFGTVSDLESTNCARCRVIAKAVMRFASMFRPGEVLRPDNVSVESDSLVKLSDLFVEIGSLSSSNPEIKRQPQFPAQIGVCFRFKDMPDRGKVELHGVTAPRELPIIREHILCVLNLAYRRFWP